MRRVMLSLAAAAGLHAGVIQGVTLEQLTGRPLARTTVTLEPVARAGAKRSVATQRATRGGQFLFINVEPGLYILTARREYYFPASYGQRLPTGRGKPIEVTAESHLFAELRMRRAGAITGRVFDENGVAEPGVPVIAYRARLPLRPAGNAVSDDRGVFRIHGLDPGKYWVRSAAHTLDDGTGWLPTYGSQGRDTREAHVFQATLDGDVPDADVTPEPGALYRLSGTIGCDFEGGVTVTLSSETGRRTAQVACSSKYQFDNLAPGIYEVVAVSYDGLSAGFVELPLGGDRDNGTVSVSKIPPVSIEVRRAGTNAPLTNVPVKLFGRRQDLSDNEMPHDIAATNAKLAPGHWELRATTPPGQYVTSITTTLGEPRRPYTVTRANDWFTIFLEQRYSTRIIVTVADQPARITGSVMAETKPVPGAPVYLWPVSESARKSLGGTQQSLSDADGQFRFENLPPGDYRAIASFDGNEVDEETLDVTLSPLVHANAAEAVSISLDLK